MIGSIAMNKIKSYLKIEKIDTETQNEILTWYVRHNKLFIKTTQQSLKIQIFKEKLNIIKKVNQKLSEIGHKIEIEDIILK
jgi:transcription initiation factor TFIIIB Brf1 subunit/transcription initiation factor TFIIB